MHTKCNTIVVCIVHASLSHWVTLESSAMDRKKGGKEMVHIIRTTGIACGVLLLVLLTLACSCSAERIPGPERVLRCDSDVADSA